MHPFNSISNLVLVCCLLSGCLARIEPTYYDEAADETALTDKFDTYRHDIQKLAGEITRLRKLLAATPSNKSISIANIQQTMANERDILFKIRAQLTLPFNYSLCDCYNWTTLQRLKLQNELDVIRRSIERLESDGTLSMKCTKAEVLNGLISSQKEYVRAIEGALNSQCCKKKSVRADGVRTPTGLVDLMSSSFQTNLKAQSWCYGSMTPDQVRLAYFSRSTNANVTNCPLVQPYWNDTHCVDCAPSEVFDLSTRRCTVVHSFDSRTHRCNDEEEEVPGAKEPEERKQTQVKVINTKQKVVTEVLQPHEQPAVPTTFITTKETHRKNVDVVMDPFEHEPHRSIIKKTRSSQVVEHTIEPIMAKPIRTTLLTTHKSEYVHRIMDPLESEPSKITVARTVKTEPRQTIVDPLETEASKTLIEKSTKQVPKESAVDPVVSEPTRTLIEKRVKQVEKREAVAPDEKDPTKSIIETKNKLVPKVETVEPAAQQPLKSIKQTKVRTAKIEHSFNPVESEPTKSIVQTKLKTELKREQIAPVEKDPERTYIETHRKQQTKVDTVNPLETDPKKSIIETKVRQDTQQESVSPVEAEPNKKLIETKQILKSDVVEPSTTDPNKSIIETKLRTSAVTSTVAPSEAPQ